MLFLYESTCFDSVRSIKIFEILSVLKFEIHVIVFLLVFTSNDEFESEWSNKLERFEDKDCVIYFKGFKVKSDEIWIKCVK